MDLAPPAFLTERRFFFARRIGVLPFGIAIEFACAGAAVLQLIPGVWRILATMQRLCLLSFQLVHTHSLVGNRAYACVSPQSCPSGCLDCRAGNFILEANPP